MKDGLILERLRETLEQVLLQAGGDFSGIGVVVCDTPDHLPLFPLRQRAAVAVKEEVISRLVSISSIDSEFHDGFHILSSNFDLTMAAQYFSPPVLDEVDIDRSKRFGGRYLAALFGSALPSVRATGIASRGFGVALFHRGAEVYFKAAK